MLVSLLPQGDFCGHITNLDCQCLFISSQSPRRWKVWASKSNVAHSFHFFFNSTNLWVSESCSVLSDSLWPHRLYSAWNSPGQNTGVGSCSLLQGIFPIQGLNPVSHIAGGFFTSWTTREAKQIFRVPSLCQHCGRSWIHNQCIKANGP